MNVRNGLRKTPGKRPEECEFVLNINWDSYDVAKMKMIIEVYKGKGCVCGLCRFFYENPKLSKNGMYYDSFNPRNSPISFPQKKCKFAIGFDSLEELNIYKGVLNDFRNKLCFPVSFLKIDNQNIWKWAATIEKPFWNSDMLQFYIKEEQYVIEIYQEENISNTFNSLEEINGIEINIKFQPQIVKDISNIIHLYTKYNDEQFIIEKAKELMKQMPSNELFAIISEVTGEKI